MTIGLILLAAAAIFMFFGGSERFFAKLGMPNWAAFLIVLALVAGAVIPQIRFGSAFSVNLGGFLIPLAVMAVFFFLCSGAEERVRALLALVAVAAVTVAARMLIPASSAGLVVTISVITGFVGAAVACIITQSRLPALAGVLGGVVVGDAVSSIVYRFFIDNSFIALGTTGVFDAIIIGVALTLIIAEALSAVKRRGKGVRAASIEAAVDTPLTQGVSDGSSAVLSSIVTDGAQSPSIAEAAALQREEASEAGRADDSVREKTPPVYNFNEEDFEDYFNDDID